MDEEQRLVFKTKKKFKEIQKNIDVLILMATPIPRTLHMSLSGIRDISIIETPKKPYSLFKPLCVNMMI